MGSRNQLTPISKYETVEPRYRWGVCIEARRGSFLPVKARDRTDSCRGDLRFFFDLTDLIAGTQSRHRIMKFISSPDRYRSLHSDLRYFTFNTSTVELELSRYISRYARVTSTPW